MGKKKDSVSSLGRNLIKQKHKDLSKHLIKSQVIYIQTVFHLKQYFSHLKRHALDLDDSQNVKSITETTTLDDFLSSAQMANIEFTAGLDTR